MSEEKKLALQGYKKRCIVVRIWTSAGNSKHPGHDVGHVSVETSESYISLWPKRAVSDEPISDAGRIGIYQPVTGV